MFSLSIPNVYETFTLPKGFLLATETSGNLPPKTCTHTHFHHLTDDERLLYSANLKSIKQTFFQPPKTSISQGGICQTLSLRDNS